MLNYIFRRLLIAIFLLIGIGIVSFVVIKLPPGDFASRYQQYLVDRGTPYDEAVKSAQIVREQYGLDQPMRGPILQLGERHRHRRQVWLVLCLPKGRGGADCRPPAQDPAAGVDRPLSFDRDWGGAGDLCGAPEIRLLG